MSTRASATGRAVSSAGDSSERAKPNGAHLALAQLEREGRVELLVTQNVDCLHEAAGSTNVVDLHGRLDAVRCMTCEQRVPREAFQQRLLASNP